MRNLGRMANMAINLTNTRKPMKALKTEEKYRENGDHMFQVKELG